MPIAAEEVLRSYGNASLQQMVRQRELSHPGKGKEAMIGLLAPTLFDRQRIRDALDDLAPVERRLLDELILRGGSAPTGLLRRQLTAEGMVKPREGAAAWSLVADKGSPWERGSAAFPDVVARLGVLGLAFTKGALTGGVIVELAQPGRRLYVPDGVLAHLPPVQLPVEPAEPPATVQPAAAGDLLRDLYVLLREVDRQPITLSARGQIPKRVLVALDQSLRVPENAATVRGEDELQRLPLLRALAAELQLVAVRGGMLGLGDLAEPFLARPAAERRAQLLAAFRRTAHWSELLRIPGVSISAKGGVPRQAPPLVLEARTRILAAVVTLPAEQWLTVAHLIARLKRTDYEFLFPRQLPPGYDDYYSSSDEVLNPYQGANALGWSFPGVLDEDDGWDLIEGGFIRLVVAALHWLGLVDLGLDPSDQLAFRVTVEGARLLQGQALGGTETSPNVVIQPNFQIFAFEPTSEDVLFRLDRLAERVRAEQATEYRLTRESVYRAQQTGWELPEILAFLERITVVPLPQNVRRSLEDWGSQHDRVVLRRGVSLVQAQDPATLDALFADSTLRPLLGRRVAPTAALVPVAHLATVTARLLEHGPMPALDEGPASAAGPQLTVDPDGRLRFRLRLPSVYLLRELNPFIDTEPDGTVRLTPASLRRAAHAGQTPDEIMATLVRWSGGELPAELPPLIRRWARDWGRGRLRSVALLEVDDGSLLADLAADPDLGPYLQPLPQAPTLAVVQPEAAERLRALLTERGMALSG